MVVDRFEGDYAVIETDNGMVNIHVSQLDANIREGDCVVFKDGRYTADTAETMRIRAEMSKRMKKLIGDKRSD